MDGAMTMELPAEPLRQMGCTEVISVYLPMAGTYNPGNMLGVVNRCFQIMQTRCEGEWRRQTSLVIEPDVRMNGWNSFMDCKHMIEAGRQATVAMLPRIKALLGTRDVAEPRAVVGLSLHPEAG